MEGVDLGWKEKSPRTGGEKAVAEKKEYLRAKFAVVGEAKPEDVRDQAAVEIAAEMANLESLAMRDWMTGALNREAIIGKAQRLASLESRHPERKLTVAILDLDDFGKLAKRPASENLTRVDIEKQADAVLRQMVVMFEKLKREQLALPGGGAWKGMDIGRLGGEEFMLVLDGVGQAQASEMLNLFREKIGAELAVASGVNEVVPRLTASIGVVEVEGRDVAGALTWADTALFSAKVSGKDQVRGVREPGELSPRRKEEDEVEDRHRHDLAERLQKEVRELKTGEDLDNWLSKMAVKFDELECSARVDSLTGLIHRGAAELALFEMMKHSLDCNEPLRLVAIDIQKFKGVNERSGMAGGDEALRAVAEALKEIAESFGGAGCQAFRWRPGGTFVLAGVHRPEDGAVGCDSGDIKARLRQVLVRWETEADVAAVDVAGLTTIREVSLAIDTGLQAAKTNKAGGQKTVD